MLDHNSHDNGQEGLLGREKAHIAVAPAVLGTLREELDTPGLSTRELIGLEVLVSLAYDLRFLISALALPCQHSEQLARRVRPFWRLSSLSASSSTFFKSTGYGLHVCTSNS